MLERDAHEVAAGAGAVHVRRQRAADRRQQRSALIERARDSCSLIAGQAAVRFSSAAFRPLSARSMQPVLRDARIQRSESGRTSVQHCDG